MKQKKNLNLNYTFKLVRMLSLCIALTTLSACAVHKASFDCSESKGMGCGSMIGVHKAIKNDEFPKESDQIQIKKNINATTAINSQTGLVYKTKTDGEHIYRSQDKIMRVWFNGYFDSQNNFHDSQYVYTIISPAEWIVTR